MKSDNEFITPLQIHERMMELIKRDPLAREWNEEWEKSRLLEEENKKFEEAGYSPLHTIGYGKGENIGWEIIHKWNLNFNPTHNPDELPLSGLKISAFPTPTVIDAIEYIDKNILPRVNKLEGQERDEFESREWIFWPSVGGYERMNNTEYVYIPICRPQIPIIIDSGGGTDIEKVLKQVRDILNKRIKERKTNISGQRKSLPRVGLPFELGFIYTSKEETFNNYLKWYDLHMGDDLTIPKGFNFRKIAAYQLIDDKEISEYEKEAAKQEVEQLGLSSGPFKERHRIEKGIKLIYKAIHRKPYPSKIKAQEPFQCQEHGDNCPQNCNYLMKKMHDFNKRNQTYSPKHNTIIGDFPDPSTMKVPAKTKGQQILGSIGDSEEGKIGD